MFEDGISQFANQALGQSIGFGISEHLADSSFDRWKDSMTRGPTYARIGLEKAGFSPILALTGGRMPGGSGVRIQGSQPGAYGPGEGVLKADLARTMQAAQISQARTQINVNNAMQAKLMREWQVMQPQLQEANFYGNWLQSKEGQYWMKQKYIQGAAAGQWQSRLLTHGENLLGEAAKLVPPWR